MRNIKLSTGRFALNNWRLLLLSLVFFFTRFINLTILPIFCDEGIYLDWGWKMVHVPGNLYFSLYDAKQPLLMWFFGISQSIFPDSLFAGRTVSVITGFTAFLGVYCIGKRFFNRNVGFIAAALFTVLPLFLFYDRQALMESAIASIGIWCIYMSILFLEKPTRKSAILLGLLLGTGFFIKSSVIPFILSIAILFMYIAKTQKDKRIRILTYSSVLVIVFIISISLLLLNPQFWQTFHSNSRYTLSLSEMLKFPISLWAHNLVGNLEIFFIFVTPLVFLSGIIGCITILRFGKLNQKILIFLFLLPIAFNILFIKTISTRYLVSFMPLVCIFAAYFLWLVIEKINKMKFLLLACVFIIPITLTTIQLFEPLLYFNVLSRITRYSDKNVYVTGLTSGYGMDDVITKLKSLENGQVTVGLALNVGVESVLQVLAHKDPKLKFVYFDSILFGNHLEGVECISTGVPFYYLSRNNELSGLDKYFLKVVDIKKKHGTDYLVVYKLNQNCKGKTISINPSLLPTY